jgi:hypothetical protein
MTRGDLKSKFTSLFNRRDLTANTALVDTFIDQAIMRVQRDLRVPAMEKMIDVTIASDYAGLVIPSDLLELKEIRPQANNKKLVKRNLDAALVASSTAGIPQIYARQGGLWILGPTPATGDVIRVTYYAEMSPLNADSDENIISIIAWDLLLQAALVNAAQFFVDKRKDDFEASYQAILQALQDQADEDSLGDDAAVEPGLKYPAEDVNGLYECV